MQKTFLVSIKRTKWERDIQIYGSIKELKKIYRLQNHIFKKVYSSHIRQMRNFEKLYKILYKDAEFVYREELSIPHSKLFPLLISFGGDNHFIYTARFATQPIIGINSDPKTSTGALLYYDVEKFIKEYERNHFDFAQNQIEYWTLIEGIIEYPNLNRVSIEKCISEITIRNEFPEHMSRYLIRKKNSVFEEQKSSGLILATGAGSSGWFYNCLPYSIQIFENPIFPKDAPYFRTIAREPGLNKIHKLQYLYTTIEKNEVLEIISEMEGSIVVDSHIECKFSFPPGSKAHFWISRDTLKVIKPSNHIP